MKTRIIFALAIAIAANTFAQQIPHRFGTVRYPSGEPAAGVQVTFYPGSYYSDDDYNYHEAITDKNGHYEVIPPKKTSMFFYGPIILTNCIMARDLEKNFAAVEAFPVVVTNVNLTLQPAITLSGSVKNTEGAPISGPEIALGFVTANDGPEIRPPFKANEQGRFSIPALPQGIEYGIRGITAKGYGSAYMRVESKDTQTNHYEFPILVLKHADHKLAGRVFDMNRKPLAGVRVSISGQGQPQNSGTNTDSNGSFAFDAICDGALKIFANYNDPRDPSLYMSLNGGGGMEVTPGDTNVLIKLRYNNYPAHEQILVTEGTVFDPAGKPAPGVMFAMWHSDNPFLHFNSGSDGKYRIRWQQNGVPTLVGIDLARNLFVIQEIDMSTTNLDLHLQPGVAIAGVVKNTSDVIITNATVSLNIWINDAGVMNALQTTTDNNGRFSFAGLPPEGGYTLDVRDAASKAEDLTGAFQIYAGDTNLVLNLAYHPPGSVFAPLPLFRKH